MAYLGVAKKNYKCPICTKVVVKGSFVYHDSSKKAGFGIVHKDCWEKLVKERGNPLQKTNKISPKDLNVEELDPPY